jgi:hypothetical protein
MEAPRSAAAEVARQVNAQISEIADSLAIRGDDGHKYTFFCECGCLQPVELALGAFRKSQQVLVDGHVPSRDGENVPSSSGEDEPPDELPPPLEPLPST